MRKIDYVDQGHQQNDQGLALTSFSMTHVASRVQRNADAPWNTFSSQDYWKRNYGKLQAEDQEIIRRVGRFFIRAFADRPRGRQAVDVGSGSNLYPALLMLPWTEQILLTDFSETNVRWLRDQISGSRHRGARDVAWEWRPFWQELQEAEGYREVSEPRKQLREACVNDRGNPRVSQVSVFDLPAAQWDLGTMFFVAESITEDPVEFGAALARFVDALKPGAPFATAFMAGSDGYPVAGTVFPALSISVRDVREHFDRLGAHGLSVDLLRTQHRVRDGYAGMVVATGFANG